MTRPTILIPGKLHPRVAERLADRFEVLKLPGSDPATLPADDASRIRAISAMAPARIDAALIDRLPNLEIIANFGVGYDAVDAGHAASKSVMVTNTPDVLTEEVADTAVALLLNTVRDFPKAERWLRDGRWPAEKSFPLTPGTLRDRTIGIFGMGRIGQAIAHRLEAFGRPIAYHNRSEVAGSPYRYAPTLLELAQSVDTLINVAPSTPQTQGAVNAEVLAALGERGVFINIGRGTTVDEPALIAALKARTIFAAGLDVFLNEPSIAPELLELDNAVLLPHVGSASVHTRNAMADLVVDNLISWFDKGEALTPVPETRTVKRR